MSISESKHSLGRPKQFTRKEGERKFSMNQNLTVLFVFFITLRIMIDANRYKGCQE
jgi:hypothetical protein